MKVAKQRIEKIPIVKIIRPIPDHLIKQAEPLWPERIAWVAQAIWYCLWARPTLVREQGHGLRALEEHEWRPQHARNWNDI